MHPFTGKTRWIALCCACVLIGAGGLWALQPMTAAQRIDDTGLQDVWVVPNEDAREVRAFLIFDRGEMDNTYAEGLAHYVEHLAWLNVYEDVQDARHANAWTNKTKTVYWQTTTPEALTETVQRLLRVTQPLTRDETFMREERVIVQSEFTLRVSEQPLFQAYRDLTMVLYDDGPRARSVIGAFDDIANFSMDDARAFHADTHVVGNATLYVTGDITARDVRRALRNVPVDRPSRPPAVQDYDTTGFRDEQALSVPRLARPWVIYYKIVPLTGCDLTAQCDVALSMLHDILTSTRRGGLAGPLRYDNFVAEGFSISMIMRDAQHLEFAFHANPDQAVSLDTLTATFEDTLSQIIADGIPTETFQNTKDRFIRDIDLLEDDAAYLADQVLANLTAEWPVYDWAAERDATHAMTLADINALLRQLAQPGRVVLRKVTPEND